LRVHLSGKSSFPGIPNILLTNISFEGVVLRAFRSGARDFFRKPVSVEELRETIAGLLSVKRASRERREPFLAAG
jgi:AraC family transcriptional regulator